MLKRSMIVAATVLVVLAANAVPAGAQQYPPAENFCTISDTTPTRGQVVDISCGTYLAGAPVTFTFFSAPVTLGTVTADASGVASISATIPSDATLGAHTITATGESAGGTLTQSIPITVVGTGAAGGAGAGDGAGAGVLTPGTFTGALPRTGNDNSLPLARAAALLLAVGGVMVLAARRRRAAADATV